MQRTARRMLGWMMMLGLFACAPGAKTHQPPAQLDPADCRLIPMQGVGKVRFGMDRDSVRRILGVPERSTELSDEYLSRGLAILYEPRRQWVAAIFCGEPGSPAWPATGPTRAPGCDYRTPEGIGINSTAEQIIAAYGNPSETTTSGEFVLLRYPAQYMELTLRDGLLKHITLRRLPEQEPVPGDADGAD